MFLLFTSIRSKYSLDPVTGKVLSTTPCTSSTCGAQAPYISTKRPWYTDATVEGNFTDFISATDGILSVAFSQKFKNNDNVDVVASMSRPIQNLANPLKKLTEKYPNSIIYVFERISWWERAQNVASPNYYLIAATDGSSVTVRDPLTSKQVRKSVLADTSSPTVRNSAKYLIDNQLLTDNIILWEQNTVAVENYDFRGLEWTIVAVTGYNTNANANCMRKYDEDPILAIKSDTDAYLYNFVRAADAVKKAYDISVIPPDAAPNTGFPATCDGCDNSNTQLYLRHIYAQYMHAGVTRVYIGWEDNSFMLYGSLREVTGLAKRVESYVYRPANTATSQNPPRNYYRASNGKVESSAPFRSHSYNVTKRNWYIDVKAYQKPMFPSIYTSASDGIIHIFIFISVFYPNYLNVPKILGTLSLVYVVPFFKPGTTVFAGAIAVDIDLQSLSTNLHWSFNKYGLVSYIMESSANIAPYGLDNPDKYKLVAVSNVTPVNDTSGGRVDATKAPNYFISKSSVNIQSNDIIFKADNLQTTTDTSNPAIPFEQNRLKYAFSNIMWDIVTTEQLQTTTQVPTSAPTVATAASANANDDFAEQTRDIAGATLAFVVIAFFGSIILWYSGMLGGKPGPVSGPASSPMHSI